MRSKERIIELYNEGITQKAIAQTLGLTIGTVAGHLGKMRRKGLIAYRGYEKAIKPPKVKEGVNKYGNLAFNIQLEKINRPLEEDPELNYVEPVSSGVHMLDLTSSMCAWPLWGHDEKPSYQCCGRSVTRGSYCDRHREVAYRTDQKPLRESIGDLDHSFIRR